MFQDSGDGSLTQARFMVRSRAWITDLQMLRQGPGFEVRSSVWDSLRLAFGSTRTFLSICAWPPSVMEFSPALWI